MGSASRIRQSSCDKAIVHRVLTVVADHEQCELLDLPPLAESIDPDALARTAQGTDAEITFSYHGYRITIEDDGRVDVLSEQE